MVSIDYDYQLLRLSGNRLDNAKLKRTQDLLNHYLILLDLLST